MNTIPTSRTIGHAAFLVMIAITVAASACAGSQTKPTPAATPTTTLSKFPDNVGVQLYSVRDQLKADLPGTLEQVKQMGLVDVELYDFHGLAPADLKNALAAAGLRARSLHQPYRRFKEDVPALIADAKALGVEFVGCAWIPHQGPYDAAINDEAIEVFTKAGQAFRDAGLRLFYHPHGFEFGPAEGGGTLFDQMVTRTAPGIVDFEIDVFWFVHGGADPLQYLRKYPNRFPLVHLKDMHPDEPTGVLTGKANKENQVVLGTGKVDIAAVVAEAERSGQVVWYFLEDESSRVLDQLPQSLTYLRQLK
jgi:sugar phosphate isomerase/epimerase